ncbi:MAG: pilin [Patescibacteria group bacterium]
MATGDFGIPQMLNALNEAIDAEHAANIGILFRERIALIINFMLALVGAIAVVMGMVAGFMYMTAYGNEERAAAAKRTIFYAAIGLAMVFSVWTILQLVTRFLGTAGENIPDVERPGTEAQHGLEGQL